MTRSRSGSDDDVEIVGSIINRNRLAHGWNPHEPDYQAAVVMSWLEILYAEKIPSEHWNGLYRAACSTRAARIVVADDPESIPMVGAEALVVEWRRMRNELAPPDPKALTGYAASRCPLCFGSGFRSETVKDTVCSRDGKPLTYKVARRCGHGKEKAVKAAEADIENRREGVYGRNWYEREDD